MKAIKLFLAISALALAQSAPKFEVASVKPTTTQGSFSVNLPPGGRFSGRNLTVQILLRNAYRLEEYQIEGGPAWINSAGFDIEARAAADAGDVSREQVQQMIQSLLADRFLLTMHRETRQLPVYNLVAGKTAPKLQPADSSASTSGTIKMGQLDTKRMSMTSLANLLAFDLRRPVMDQTGLKGEFAFTLEWTRGMAESDPGDPARPSLFTAVQEQLGLKLESAKGPVEVYVIDRLEKPSEN